MKIIQTLIIFIIIFIITGCVTANLKPIKIDNSIDVNYLKDVKPILDKRCVTCHSCYNAPCQSKFSSFEGIDRGASKQEVYNATRLSASDPTRLFIDAKTTQQWRQKKFYSLTESLDTNSSYNDSLFLHMLHQKQQKPQVVGDYEPDYDNLSCPKNKEELTEYFEDKPNHAMPYGFPKITDNEYNIIANWLKKGAKGPTHNQQNKITSPSKKAAIEIKKWESFFNNPDKKHTLTARYLYEHLYLAHWHFKSSPKEFFKIVRSYTEFPKPIEVISSLRPFDDPKVKKFYYRLQKIHSTIVHKTHMVVEFDDKKLTRLRQQFIEIKWIEQPHYMNYDKKASANPFVTYFQIPAKSRYQFLLDNSHYIIMTFIRGPVCKGQMALNVIHDHFWVMFKDPKYDITIQRPSFLLYQANNLSIPIETTSQSLIKIFSDEYRDKAKEFIIAKEKLYDSSYSEGLGIESIWKGEKASDAPALTIYRHFNSASVHKGVLGQVPKTMWVIDYPQFERIYYSLVAGYDVFGNVSHQTNIRRYMDFLRVEGELNFLSYMPKDVRLEMFKSWYIGVKDVERLKKLGMINREENILYESKNFKEEFVNKLVHSHFLKSTNIKFDTINYNPTLSHLPKMPKKFNTINEIRTALSLLSVKENKFIKQLIDQNSNNILVRIIMENKESYVFSIIINRWHNNVNSLFNEESTLNIENDTLDFVEGSVGSYPNMFVVVKNKDLGEFFDILQNYDGSEIYNKKIIKYFTSRADSKFWERFDWFQNHFYNTEPITSGLYDLNRYYKKSW